jgi:hypothetical protein
VKVQGEVSWKRRNFDGSNGNLEGRSVRVKVDVDLKGETSVQVTVNIEGAEVYRVEEELSKKLSVESRFSSI